MQIKVIFTQDTLAYFNLYTCYTKEEGLTSSSSFFKRFKKLHEIAKGCVVMFKWLLLAIILLPAIEIGVLIWIGGYIGPLWVIILIGCTGIFGLFLAKKEGMDTIARAKQAMQMGYSPQEEIIDGICILIGGLFLLTPGFVTDTIGFILLLPPTRKPLKVIIRDMLNKMMQNGRFTLYRR
jgi:UPF0716 protein FxsA